MANETSSSNSFMSDALLNKLAESLTQHAASVLTSTQLPTFSGGPTEDVHDFLKNFELSTITFSPQLKCMALQKSLTESARTWGKLNLKNLISTNDWKAIKKALIERFQGPNPEIRYLNKLAKLTYDPKKVTLTSFVERFAEYYRKAYQQARDIDVIRAIRLKLPNKIILAINTLCDQWTDFQDLSTMYALTRRTEANLLAYEDDGQESEKLTPALLTKMLAELKESLANRADPPKPEPVEATACAVQVRPVIKREHEYPNRSLPRPRDPPIQIRRPNSPVAEGNYKAVKLEPGTDRSALSYNRQNQHRFHPRPNRTEEARKAYVSRFGNPPGPCQICQGFHFNRHCPLQSDLK